MQSQNRGPDWLKQAKADLRYATAAPRDGFFAQTCFICQQAAEKALKSILYARGARVVLSHSLHRLCDEVAIDGDLLQAARILDQYYITARYPDALAEGTPDEVFTVEQARTALGHGQAFVAKAEGLVA